jgi:hypothetical protein
VPKETTLCQIIEETCQVSYLIRAIITKPRWWFVNAA